MRNPGYGSTDDFDHHIDQIAAGLGELHRLDVEFIQHQLAQPLQTGFFVGVARTHHDFCQRLTHLQVGILACGVCQTRHLLRQRHIHAQLLVDQRSIDLGPTAQVN